METPIQITQSFSYFRHYLRSYYLSQSSFYNSMLKFWIDYQIGHLLISWDWQVIYNNYYIRNILTTAFLGILTMLKVHSPEWNDFISKLEVIKTKSNREVLCI
jgi:hypothetical protein